MSRLFAVDDDPACLALIEQAAISLGCSFEGFTTLAQARERLRVQEPTLLLIDGLLPDGDGMDFLRELGENGRLPPLTVFLSFFFRDLRSYRELLSLGVDRVLHKPIAPQSLRREIAPPSRRSLVQNSSQPCSSAQAACKASGVFRPWRGPAARRRGRRRRGLGKAARIWRRIPRIPPEA